MDIFRLTCKEIDALQDSAMSRILATSAQVKDAYLKLKQGPHLATQLQAIVEATSLSFASTIQIDERNLDSALNSTLLKMDTCMVQHSIWSKHKAH